MHYPMHRDNVEKDKVGSAKLIKVVHAMGKEIMYFGTQSNIKLGAEVHHFTSLQKKGYQGSAKIYIRGSKMGCAIVESWKSAFVRFNYENSQ